VLLAGAPHGFSTRDGVRRGTEGAEAPIVRLKQVHSAKVVTVSSALLWPEGSPPEADAMVSDRAGLRLGIVTADCAPVLFADFNAGVVGAAHAGWRGAVDGVLGNTVAAMESLGAQSKNIVAVIGPCIAQENYEVDGPFRERFGDADSRHFAPGQPGHWQFDLPGFVAARLRQVGLAKIHDLARDTYAEESCFYSYRRATHRGEDTGGRQISLIGLEI